MQFDPTAFILAYQDLFVTMGLTVALGMLSLVSAAISLFLVLRSEP